MRTRPLKHYPTPRFPTRYILYAHPELLRLVPRRWRKCPVVLAALAGVCVVLMGCREVAGGGATPSRVAPLFVHGQGEGAFGCIVVNPPVFLTEAQARRVIAEEAAKAGIVFQADASRAEIAVPKARGSDRGPAPQDRVTLVLDGTEAKRHIAYEYVSDADFDAWSGGARSTVRGYDTRAMAAGLREELAAERPAGAYGVFYDPVGSIGDAAWTRDDKAKPGPRSEQQLRAQVKDFIAWLKAQGVI
jgi:hypothetical protein